MSSPLMTPRGQTQWAMAAVPAMMPSHLSVWPVWSPLGGAAEAEREYDRPGREREVERERDRDEDMERDRDRERERRRGILAAAAVVVGMSGPADLARNVYDLLGSMFLGRSFCLRRYGLLSYSLGR
jgi:hypothetical protein